MTTCANAGLPDTASTTIARMSAKRMRLTVSQLPSKRRRSWPQPCHVTYNHSRNNNPGSGAAVKVVSCLYSPRIREKASRKPQLCITASLRAGRKRSAGRVVLNGQVAIKGRRDSDLQPRLLKVDLAQDPVHRLVRELPGASHPQQRLALRPQHEVHHLLVGERAVLVPLVLDLPGAGREAALAILVEGAHPLDRLVASPLLARQGVELLDRGLGRYQPRADLLVRVGAAVAHPEVADQGWQGEPLHDEGEEDDREGEEDDEVALGEAAAGIGRERQRKRHRERNSAPHPAPGHHEAPPGSRAPRR